MHLTPALLLERHVPFRLRQANKALLSLSCIPLLSHQFGSESVMLLMS